MNARALRICFLLSLVAAGEARADAVRLFLDSLQPAQLGSCYFDTKIRISSSSQPVAGLGGPFEVEVLRRVLHLLREAANGLVEVLPFGWLQ